MIEIIHFIEMTFFFIENSFHFKNFCIRNCALKRGKNEQCLNVNVIDE